MKNICLTFVLGLIIFSSCRKETNKPTANKLLWKLERYQVERPGVTFVTYFFYDALFRVSEASTYFIDSTIVPLDSVLCQKYTFRYSGSSNNPDSVEFMNRANPSSPYYEITKNPYTYNGTQLIYDSLYLVYNYPPPYNFAKASSYSYSGSEIYCTVNRYYGLNFVGSGKDTFIIQTGNLIKYASRSQPAGGPPSGYSVVITYSFDDKINPVKIPWPSLVHTDAIFVNNNNVVSSLYGHSQDSILRTSQFQYDVYNYPIVQYETENYFSPAPMQIHNVITYKYY